MSYISFRIDDIEAAAEDAAAISEIQRRLAAGEPVEGISSSRPF